MEKSISLIAKGEASHAEVLKSELEIYHAKFLDFVARVERMDQLFEATFSPVSSSGKPFSKCGVCRRYMV